MDAPLSPRARAILAELEGQARALQAGTAAPPPPATSELSSLVDAVTTEVDRVGRRLVTLSGALEEVAGRLGADPALLAAAEATVAEGAPFPTPPGGPSVPA